MDIVLFSTCLVNLCCCCIITTSIVFKLLYFPIVKESYYEEELSRYLKSTFIFLLVELISGFMMVLIDADTLVPFILLIIGWVASAVSFYYNYQLFDINTLATELLIRRTTYVRLLLWFARFVCIFAFTMSIVLK